ncbi:GIY-YIG nuclease family protein [Streptomyces hydrogenans]
MNPVVYVLTHPEYKSTKVGHTHVPHARMRELGKYGWWPYRSLNVASKNMAWAIEQQSLFTLRHRLLVPAHLTSELLPAGWSETASQSLISSEEVWETVCVAAAETYMEPVIGEFRPTPPRPTGGYQRTKSDTPKYVPIARLLAAETARAAQSVEANKRRASRYRKEEK